MTDNSEYSPDEGYTAREKELRAQMLKDARELERALETFKRIDPEGFEAYWMRELQDAADKVGRRFC